MEPWGCLSCSPCSSGTFLNPTTSNFWLWFGLKVADLSRISQYDHGTITTLRLTEYSDLYEIIHPSIDLAEVVCGARSIKSRCINHTSLLGWLNQDGSRRILLFHEKQSPMEGPESIYWTTGNRKNSVWQNSTLLVPFILQISKHYTDVINWHFKERIRNLTCQVKQKEKKPYS